MRACRDGLDGLLGLTKRRETAHGRFPEEKGEGGCTSVVSCMWPGKTGQVR